MQMLPCPKFGAFRRFRKIAVFAAFRVDERYVAVVGFGLFVHHVEHARRARQAHGDHGYLLRHFVYSLRGSSRHAEKRYDKPERNGNQSRFKRRNADVFNAGRKQQAAANRKENIGEIADIAENRTEYVAVDVRVFRIGIQLFGILIEIGFGALFVGENFHHFLPFHHLFHKAFFAAERALLRHHIFRGRAAHFLHYEEHTYATKHEHRRHDYGIPKHERNRHKQRERA